MKIAAILFLTSILYAQPAFDADSVTAHDPKVAVTKGGILPGGGLEVKGMTVEDLLTYAYGMLPSMISGLPKWAKGSQFDVIAKAPPGSAPASLRLMLQTLLAERFQLESHREDRPMPAYVLTAGKQENKMQAGSGTQPHCSWSDLPSGVSRRACENISMAELARQLPGLGRLGIDLPVVDQTGLEGTWDFHLDVRLLPPNTGAASERPNLAPAPEGPTIFDAFDQLGLKLEIRKVSLPVLVVDHIGQLREN